MIYLNGTSKVSVSRYRVIIWGFPNTIGKVGKVAGKSLKQSSRTVLYKSCSWKFLKPLVFSCEFCEFLSKNASFYRTPLVAASVKACNFTKIRLCHWCFFVNFLKIFGTLFWWAARKNVRKKSLCRWLFRENYNTINCDDNHDAICSLILRRLLLLGSPCNEISLEVRERFICIAARPFYLD